MTTVAIPFVRIDASQNPNVSVAKNADPAEPYLRTMTVAFGSIRRWNPEIKLELISNAELPGFYKSIFEKLGVHTRIVAFDHRPPKGFSSRFTASLYLLDALQSIQQSTLLIDPDVLCIKSLNSLLQKTNDRLAGLPMNFPQTEDINGLTREGAGVLHGLLGEPETSPIHYGGEIYNIPLKYAAQLRQRTEEAWLLTLRQHNEGAPKFTTEEHILSYALKAFDVIELDQYIRRIWTTHRYRTVNGKENELAMWHLPAEKDRGFLALFPEVSDGNSWFWNASEAEFRQRAGKAMGLHNRSFPRFALDFAGRTARSIEDRSRKLKSASVLR